MSDLLSPAEYKRLAAERRAQGRAGNARELVIPQPPPLNLTPRSDRALVTIAVGPEAEAMLAVTRPYLEAYARRLVADLVVLAWPGHPAWPMSSKFILARVLEHYPRMAYIDADVFPRPGCVNLFDLCAPDEVGLCDELAWHRASPQHQVENDLLAFRQRMGFAPVADLPFMFNCGVMVWPAGYRELLLPPAGPIVPTHCAEQHHTNARVLDEFLAGRVKLRLLDRRGNWQLWTDYHFPAAPRDALLHFSGCRGPQRLARMRALAAEVGPPPADCSPRPGNPGRGAGGEGDKPHLWQVDERHRRWLSAVLASGQFRSVLEIGSFQGYSTRAFLEACAAGNCDQVHLCEPTPTPELLALLEKFALDRLTLDRRPSLDLLRQKDRRQKNESVISALDFSAFELVFVDGDHSADVVSQEAALLLAARVPVVFAHDTAAARYWPGCDGPQLLKREFQAAGYFCLEDSEHRPAERTHRGMFCACLEREHFEICRAAYVREVLV